MAIRENLIQARSLYVGVSPNVAPASSNLGVDGSIGIGTSTPISALSIYRGSGSNAYIEVSGGGSSLGSTSIVYGQDSDQWGYVWNRANQPVAFGTNNSLKMILTAAGELAVGTSSPLLYNSGRGNITINGSTQSILTLGVGSVWRSYLYTDGVGTDLSAANYLVFGTNGGSERMRITNGGNVGIGTTNPGSQLQIGGYFQIESNANYTGMLGFNRNVNNGQILNPSYGAYQLQNYQGTLQLQVYNSSGSGITEHRFYTNGNVNFNGQLGVTTDPVASLDNQGNLGTYRQRGVTTMVTNELAADGTNANRYEIARATIDYNDWNDTGTIEIELYEKYWSDGLKKRYIVTYGYSAQANKYLVEMSGIGVNNFMVSIGAPVTITGDIRYLPIYVDVRYYTRVIAVVKTNRRLTTNNPPWVGEIWFNNAPSITYISDTGMDSTVYVGPVMGATSIFSGGYVGMGTSAPTSNLHVLSNSSYGSINDQLKLEGTISGGNASNPAYYGGLMFAGNGYEWSAIRSIQTNPNASFANRLAFYTMQGGAGPLTERMAIDNYGNVGIGTSDPAAYPYGEKLNVNGSISSSGGKIGFSTTDSFTAYGYSAAHYGLSYSLGSVNPVTLSGYYGIGFFTTGSEKMRIAENGNVGIGTSAPPARLAVAGNNAGLALIGDTGLTHYTGISLNNNLSSGTYNFLSSPYDNSLFINRPSGNNIHFRENNNDQMVIRYGGLVGINTSNPQGFLDVNTGSANMTTYDYGVDLKVNAGGGFARSNRQYDVQSAITSFLGSYGNSTTGVERAYWTIGDRNSDVTGYTLTNGIHLLANGNVGIGTSTPNKKLTVSGEISSNYGSNQGALWLGEIALQNAYFTSYGILDFTMHNGGGYSDVMRIQGNGNVGIGTTNPQSKLQIGDSYNSTSGSVKLITLNTGGYYSTTPANQYNVMGFTGTVIDNSDIYSQTSGEVAKNFYMGIISDANYFNNNRFSIVQGGVERLTVQGYANGGNVGIGTTSPAAKLEVYGSGSSSSTVNFLARNSSNVKIIESFDNGFIRLNNLLNTNQAIYINNGNSNVHYALDSHIFNVVNDSFQRIDFVTIKGNAGKPAMGVGTMSPDNSAILDLTSRSKGFLPPRMSNSDMNAIPLPAAGLVVYDVSNNKLTVYTGSGWVPLH